MAKNNSLRGKSKEEISRHYTEALDGYKALLKKTPDYELKRFCEEAGISYHGMKSWMLYRGFRVQDLQSEAYNKDRLGVSAPSSGQFIQISPAEQRQQPVCQDLHGVSITFTDGVSLTIQDCGTDSVISLITACRVGRHGGRAAIYSG